MRIILFLMSLFLGLTSCGSGEKQTKTEHMQPVSRELIFKGKIADLIAKSDQYQEVNTLVLDTEITCADLTKLCQLSFFRNLEYLLFYDYACDACPKEFSKLIQLEKLIVNSADLTQMPEVFLQLPKLRHLQLDLQDYKTYSGIIPVTCILEEIEFQSTPVDELGNLSLIKSLKKVGIIAGTELKIQNDKIEMVYH